jgi:hypothetical protein
LLDQSRYLLLIFREKVALPEYPDAANEAGRAI